MIVGVIVLAILIIVILGQYNAIMKLKMKVQQSKSGIDVYLQQRFELIPNLVETVKGYMNYEQETLEKITQLRTKYNHTKDLQTGEELERGLNNILLITESYPELKASEQFLNLQKNLKKVESQLQAARRIYNNDVTNYNIKINMVPYNIISKIFGFKDERLFEVEGSSRENINVEL